MNFLKLKHGDMSMTLLDDLKKEPQPYYLVVYAYSIEELENMVTKYLRDGWGLAGNFSAINDGKVQMKYFQPIIKKY